MTDKLMAAAQSLISAWDSWNSPTIHGMATMVEIGKRMNDLRAALESQSSILNQKHRSAQAGRNAIAKAMAGNIVTTPYPEQWACVAEKHEPRKRGLTGWYMGAQAPDMVGFYQRYYTDGIYFDYWDGFFWRTRAKDGVKHWRQVGDYVAWRGLTRSGWHKACAKRVKA